MQRRSLVFAAPGRVEVKAGVVPNPGPGEVLVEADWSAISAGTELLIFEGRFPSNIQVDTTIPELNGPLRYPLGYGYATVGRVVALGPGVAPDLEGQPVFAFRCHESHFCVAVDRVIRLDPGLALDDAVFFAAMETAISIVHDTATALGETGAVFGLGVIGQLVAGLLSRFPLRELRLWEPSPKRRAMAQAIPGATIHDPGSETPESRSADFAVEVSGTAAAFDAALASLGHGGRLIVGSWYGAKPVAVDLGSWFHQGRIKIVSSQVSAIGSDLAVRWTKARRYDLVKTALADHRPSRLITHRFPIEDAQSAYELLRDQGATALQVVFHYR